MKHRYILLHFLVVFAITSCPGSVYSQSTTTVQARTTVTLPEAHIGNLDIDTKLLDSYGVLPQNIRQFYLDARSVFSKANEVSFANAYIVQAANKHDIDLMGGPLLGNLSENGVFLWVRPAASTPIVVSVINTPGSVKKTYVADSVDAGVEQRIVLDELSADTEYSYKVFVNNKQVTKGRFRTAPPPENKSTFRVTFGSCLHKIGLHNPNLVNQILKRQPHAMMLLGDIAVDDRENNINMHRSDYLLRDVSKPWQNLAANVPIYSSWDDHDYLNNDLSGIPARFTSTDRDALRAVWMQNWNNPDNERDGIYFNTRLGPVELIMLDTRSCRNINERGQYGSYLGSEQLDWLKGVLKTSTAQFKIISSGTMWSDYVSNGKDSWGTWDTLAREEIFELIETNNIPGVLLISGDRHGARGFSIPRSEGFSLYEFEAASLGGVPGPNAMAKDSTNQLFGYHGTDAIAFGEFTFNTNEEKSHVTFRLIDELGHILEEHEFSYRQLTPRKVE